MAQNRQKQHKCDICKRRFERLSDLKRHNRLHSGDKPFTCDVCDKAFSQSGNLLVHKRTHNGDKPFKCSLCNKKFSQRSSLVRHERTHTGVKPFKCGKCGKAFSNPYHLICHKRTHARVKPYKCPTCCKTFSQCSGLIQHKRTHTGDKSFKCNNCCKEYLQASGLEKHKREHICELFSCNVCDKQFLKSSSFVKHWLTHAGRKNFDCNVRISDVLPAKRLLERKRTHTGKNVCKFDARVEVTRESYKVLSQGGFSSTRQECNDGINSYGSGDVLQSKHSFDRKRTHTGENVSTFDARVEVIKEPNKILSQEVAPSTRQDCNVRISSNCIGDVLQAKRPLNHNKAHTGKKLNKFDIRVRVVKESYSILSQKVAPSVDQEKSYQCDFCERDFSSSDLLTSHKEFHTGQRLCDVVSHEEFEYHLDRELDAKEPTGITYICADCGHEFQLVDELFKHCEVDHSSSS